MFSVLVLVLMLVSSVKVEKLQPVSVAGNPVGQCLSCKLLKIHPQHKMHPGLGAPEDNTQVFRYVYCHPQEVGSYITLARILEEVYTVYLCIHGLPQTSVNWAFSEAR